MNYLYKSIALNIIAAIGLYFIHHLYFFFSHPNGGQGAIFAFIFMPISIIYVICIGLGLIIEFICYKSKLKAAFNFPYKKINKWIYYPLFFAGLLAGIFPIIFIILITVIYIIYNLFGK